MPNTNPPVPDAREFYVLNTPAIGTAFSDETSYPQNRTIPKLFQSLTIRDFTFKNRIWVSPMCQYSSKDGFASDWHFVHISSFATRGAGAITMEASAVSPEGRISPEDLGIYSDEHIPGLKRIVDFVHSQGSAIGIQLAHAGRKASTYAPWVEYTPQAKRRTSGETASVEENGWPDDVWAPSAIPFSPGYPQPKALTEERISTLKDQFVQAARRAKEAGFDFIELHAAHGYLLTEFLSPLSNKRTDKYGGSFENRTRLLQEIVTSVRAEWSGPLFVRISVTEYAQEEYGPEKSSEGEWKWWGIEQSKLLVSILEKLGVDLIDASSGGNYVKQVIVAKAGYQVPLAAALKRSSPNILVSAVGLITEPKQAEDILQEGSADVVFLARELLRRVDFPLIAAQELGVAVKPAAQYERAWSRMLGPRSSL